MDSTKSFLATMLSTRPTQLTISQNKNVRDGDGILDNGYADDLKTSPDKLIKACRKPGELDLLTASADSFVVV